MSANVHPKDVVGGGLVPLALGGHANECEKGRLVRVVSNHREYASGEWERLQTVRETAAGEPRSRNDAPNTQGPRLLMGESRSSFCHRPLTLKW